MVCESCGEKPKNTAKDFTKAVIEINNPEKLVLFRKVVIPASMGDETEVPAAIGKYHNVLLVYEFNNHTYLYSSDGIPTLLTSDVAKELEEKIDAVAGDLQTETANRQDADAQLSEDIRVVAGDLATEVADRTNADGVLQANINAEALARGNADTALGNRLTTVEGIAATALQPADIDKVVTTDIALNPATSTSTVQINESKVNLSSGATTSETISLPVASTTQAGVMNSSTYDAITANTNNLNAIMNGAVAITGISANPSQIDLTNAWLAETDLPYLINRSSIYDVDNDKVWTYYTNDTTWHAASNTSQVTISTFTNSSEGTIKGSTNTGQVFAENDGTGSVNGWDTLSSSVSTNASNITSLQTAVSGKQDILTAGSNISISPQNVISATVPTVNDATLTIQKNGTTVQTFTANASSNATANIEVPTITMTTTDPGEGSALAADNFVAVYGGDPIIMDYSTSEINTGATWIDGSTIYKKTISTGNLPSSAGSITVAHGISNLGRILKIEGSYVSVNDGFTFPVNSPAFGSDNQAAIRTVINGANIQVTVGTDRSNCDGYVTLYYTKSA